MTEFMTAQTKILEFIAKHSGYSIHTIKGFLYNHSDRTCRDKIRFIFNVLVENDYPYTYNWNNFQDCPTLLNLKSDLELWGKVRREQKRTGRPKGSPNKTASQSKLYTTISAMMKEILGGHTQTLQDMYNKPHPVYIQSLRPEIKSEIDTSIQTQSTDIKNEIQYRTSEIADNVEIVMIEQFKKFKNDMEQTFKTLETNIKTIEANLDKLRWAENKRHAHIIEKVDLIETKIESMNKSNSVYDFPDITVDEDVTVPPRAPFVTQSQLIESRNLVDSVNLPHESPVQ